MIGGNPGSQDPNILHLCPLGILLVLYSEGVSSLMVLQYYCSTMFCIDNKLNKCRYKNICMYRLNVFLHPLPKVPSANCLDIRNPWRKVMEKSGLMFEIFCLEMVQNPRKKKIKIKIKIKC